MKTRRDTHGLRERLTTSSSSEISVETEGLGNGQVSLECVHGGTRSLLGGEDVTSSDVKTRLSIDVSIDRTRDNRQILIWNVRKHHPGQTRERQSRPRTWALGRREWRGAERRSRLVERWG